MVQIYLFNCTAPFILTYIFDSLGEMHGEEIKFSYTKDIFWNEHFVWINTYFPEYFKLREKMGLAHTHEDNENWSHITIGKFRKIGQLNNFTDYTKPIPKKW